MTRPGSDDRLVCVALTYLAEPADPLLGEVLRILPKGEVDSSFVPPGRTRALRV
jgi:hypothetical protein